MELDPEILDWLILLEVIEIRSKIQLTPKKKYLIEPQMASKFANGLYMIQVIRKILERRNMNTSMFTNMKFMETASTPVARLYNWNLVSEALRMVGISLDQDSKNLIVSGDLKMVHLVIEELYKKDRTWMVPEILPLKPSSLNLKKQNRDQILTEFSLRESEEFTGGNRSKDVSLPLIRNHSVVNHLAATNSEASKLTNFNGSNPSPLVGITE